MQNAAVILKEDSPAGGEGYRAAASQGLEAHGEAIASGTLRAIGEMVRDRSGSFVPQDLSASTLDSDRLRGQLEALKASRSSFVVPIRTEEGLLGWISLGEKRSESLYTSEDRELLETLANQAAVAVTNALAFEKIVEGMLQVKPKKKPSRRKKPPTE